MHAFDWRGRTRDGSHLVFDVPRTWMLVKELVDAPEATVQFIFIYEPLAQLLIDHAKQIGEPQDLIVRARRAMRQPGDSARHDDHMHVRIYCSNEDRDYGCVDMGPMELLAEREAKHAASLAEIAAALPSAPPSTLPSAPPPEPALNGAPPPETSGAASLAGASAPTPPSAAAAASGSVFRSLLRAGPDRIDLRRWR